MNRINIDLPKSAGKILYIVAGCNGSGKTTAFRNRLSADFEIPVFINADEIARELCPGNVDSVALVSGREMLLQIDKQLEMDVSFCIETTLSGLHYRGLIEKAHDKGFKVALFFFWLDSPELAVLRVAKRVESGGHNIPVDVIHRRYHRGLCNLFSIYIPLVDYWRIENNSGFTPDKIAVVCKDIYDSVIYSKLVNYGK